MPFELDFDIETEGLFGTEDATLDDKSRVLVAKKKRDCLGPNFVMCQGDNGCLFAYSAKTWAQIVRSVMSKDPTNQGRQTYSRLVLATAEVKLNFDVQGRVVIPKRLKDKAGIKDKGSIVILGCGDRLEIWAAEEFERYEADMEGYGIDRLNLIRKAKQEMDAE